jgi:hypothetical protein
VRVISLAGISHYPVVYLPRIDMSKLEHCVRDKMRLFRVNFSLALYVALLLCTCFDLGVVSSNSDYLSCSIYRPGALCV